jgi:succinate dehydrogenase / fumarate reductase membrane anchor subunit
MSDASKTARDQHIQVMRSQLGRVRGLGAAKSGAGTWWAERLTSIALVPLTLWFIWSVLHLVGASHDDLLNWIADPVRIVLLISLLIATFHHMQLGLTVVIEDYVHVEWVRLVLLLVTKAICFVFALAGIVSVLKMGL